MPPRAPSSSPFALALSIHHPLLPLPPSPPRPDESRRSSSRTGPGTWAQTAMCFLKRTVHAR